MAEKLPPRTRYVPPAESPADAFLTAYWAARRAARAKFILRSELETEPSPTLLRAIQLPPAAR